MFTASAFAHPVSYQGAVSLMSYNSEDENEILATYSVRNYLAVGLTYQREDQVYYTVPRVNFLVHRWNNEDSQANIYASGGYGTERSFDETVGVGLAAIEADWESRQYYTSGQYTRFLRKDSDDIDRVDFETIKLRAGVAPYLGEFNEINSWFILQTEKMNDKQWELTPFIRMFYKNVLIEIGAGFNGSYAFNFMVHF
jgi:hypothetical protein